ncbi:MAG: MATE family efflux transporter [Acidobacteria bacterium]|nr:MATE family efflux transporter [Acidobacteriota bacterium]
MEFGFPNGIQFFMEMFGYSTFLLLVGSLDTSSFSATTIAFNINNIAFMPLLGLGLGISVLVGQAMGQKNANVAEKVAYSGSFVAYFYIVIICSLYLFLPTLFVNLFETENSENFMEIKKYSIILLRFVAFYTIFDTLNIIFSGVLRGAGDTKFLFKVISFMSVFVLIIPTYIAVHIFNSHIYSVWVILSAQVCLLGLIFLYRFKLGKWKKINIVD